MTASRISLEMIDRSFGLMATVENKRVVLPLKAVECEFAVAAGLVEVTMTHVFRQENPKPLDCDYLFPLPADASVYFCEADFNGRIIRAVVKERGEAVRLAEEKKAEGRRVALVESERWRRWLARRWRMRGAGRRLMSCGFHRARMPERGGFFALELAPAGHAGRQSPTTQSTVCQTSSGAQVASPQSLILR